MSDPKRLDEFPPLPDYSPPIAIDDVGCIRCGYALRGLPRAGACPECGMPVARSVQGSLLSFANPMWLQTVVRGLGCVLLAGVVLAVTNRLQHYQLEAIYTWWEWLWGRQLRVSGPRVLLLAGTIIGLIGFWRATTREPATPPGGRSPRVTLRWSCAASGVCYLMLAWGESISMTWFAGLAVSYILMTAVLNTIQVVAGCRYLRMLALRIPNPHIARWLGIAGILMALAMIGDKLAGAALWIVPAQTQPSYATWARIAVLRNILEWGVLLTGTFGFLVVLRMLFVLRICVREARRGWVRPLADDASAPESR